MLLKQRELERIVAGDLTVVFRRWIRPTVRSGGTLVTAVGVLAIDSVTPLAESEVTEADARRAGYESRDAVLAKLSKRDGALYRIELHYAGPDPRVLLRARTDLDEGELSSLRSRLETLDSRSAKPWTIAVLTLIGSQPGVLAALLAHAFGQERLVFKRNVRKLKELGLTESLEIGYRLSPRGQILLKALKSAPEPPALR